MKRIFITLSLLWLGAAPATFAQGVTLPEHERVELDNGIVFVLHEKRDVPLIGASVYVKGGAATDPAGKAGVASLLAEMLEKGAGDRDAAAFAEAIDAVGGVLSTSASPEGITISADFLARDGNLLIELLVDMLQSPTLDSREFQKLRDRRIDLITAAKDGDPRRLTAAYGVAWLLGDHPYGTPVDGSEASLSSIRHRDLVSWYDDYVGADRTIIALVGDFDTDAMLTQLTEAFSDWRTAATSLEPVEPPTRQEGRRVLLVDKPGATQSYFWLGNTGVSIHYPQRAELNIANTLFGGRFTSMLVEEMRTKAGLTYGVSSRLNRLSNAGTFAIVSFTATETTLQAIDLALDLLDRLHTTGFAEEDGFSEEILASGKNYILGQFPPRLETAEQLADQFAMLAAYDLDASYINDYGAAVTGASAEAIQAVIAEAYPHRDDLAIVIIGDAETIREDIAKYGPVTEIAITEPYFRPQDD